MKAVAAVNYHPVQPQASLKDCLDLIQRRTFRYFWDAAHPQTGLPYDKLSFSGEKVTDAVSISGVGFGLLAIIVAVDRGWIEREAAAYRVAAITGSLMQAPRFHGAFPHLIHGSTLKVIPFSPGDDGADLVETTFLLQGLICARQYFDIASAVEIGIRKTAATLIDDVDWNGFEQGPDQALYWHWSARHGWAMNLPIRGWNEALSTYVLAAGSRRFPISVESYHQGWARSGEIQNGNCYLGTELPLGEPFGGPLFLSQYSFCALDPHGLSDRYADYWQQAVAHARINHDYCRTVPAYEAAGVWGLTASETPYGYSAHSPACDTGVIAPTAALSSFPFLPREAEAAMRALLRFDKGMLFGDCGFVDSFSPETGWRAQTCLAIDQGAIIAMIENYRSGLPWRLFMQDAQVRRGLNRLGFSSERHPLEPPLAE